MFFLPPSVLFFLGIISSSTLISGIDEEDVQPSDAEMQNMLNWALNHSDPHEMERRAREGETLSSKYTPEEIQQIMGGLFARRKQPDVLKEAVEALDMLVPFFEELGNLHGEMKNGATKEIPPALAEEYDVVVDPATTENLGGAQLTRLEFRLSECGERVVKILEHLEDLLQDTNYAELAERVGATQWLMHLVVIDQKYVFSPRGAHDLMEETVSTKEDEEEPDAPSSWNNAHSNIFHAVSEAAAWCIGSMLQNNFPVQAEFWAVHGQEFLKYRHLVTSLGDRPKLFFAFSALLRSGNPEIVELCTDYLVKLYELVGLYVKEQSGEPTNTSTKIVVTLQHVKKINFFLWAINQLPVYSPTFRQEYFSQQKNDNTKFINDDVHQNWGMNVNTGWMMRNKVKLTYLEHVKDDHITPLFSEAIEKHDYDLFKKTRQFYLSAIHRGSVKVFNKENIPKWPFEGEDISEEEENAEIERDVLEAAEQERKEEMKKMQMQDDDVDGMYRKPNVEGALVDVMDNARFGGYFGGEL